MLRQFKKALARNTRVGVAVDGTHCGVARVRRTNDGALSLAIRVLESGDSNWPDHAASPIADMQLEGVPASAVLGANAYQLQLVEMPNVPADEMLAAVRWRIKDLIDYPVDEAVVEILEMPRHANPGHAPIAYAVVTRRANVQQQIDLMKQTDLHLDVIDIPELCIRNIAVMLPHDAAGAAFLHFAEDCGYLTITREGVLYLTRHLETGRRALAAASSDAFALQERIAGIALELQRSLDYYESHYDCRPVTEVTLGPGADLDGLPDALSEHLGLTVKQIDLNALFKLEDATSPGDQGNSLLAIGAALRSGRSAQLVAPQ